MAPAVSCFRPFAVDGPLASKSIRRVLGASLLGVCVLARAAEAPARFDVSEYRVNGNSRAAKRAPSRGWCTRSWARSESIEDVDGARGALEKAYADAGYRTVVVNLPQQEVRGGMVRLEVRGTAGRTGCACHGARYFSPGRMKAAVPALAEGTMPHFPTVQQQLDRLRGNPDREFFQVLRDGRSPGRGGGGAEGQGPLPLHGTVVAERPLQRPTPRACAAPSACATTTCGSATTA